jgi:hypothetical protein
MPSLLERRPCLDIDTVISMLGDVETIAARWHARSEVPLEFSIQVPATGSSVSSTLRFRDHESISVQRVTNTPRAE